MTLDQRHELVRVITDRLTTGITGMGKRENALMKASEILDEIQFCGYEIVKQ